METNCWRSIATAPVNEEIEVMTWNFKKVRTHRKEATGNWFVDGKVDRTILPTVWRRVEEKPGV